MVALRRNTKEMEYVMMEITTRDATGTVGLAAIITWKAGTPIVMTASVGTGAGHLNFHRTNIVMTSITMQGVTGMVAPAATMTRWAGIPIVLIASAREGAQQQIHLHQQLKHW